MYISKFEIRRLHITSYNNSSFRIMSLALTCLLAIFMRRFNNIFDDKPFVSFIRLQYCQMRFIKRVYVNAFFDRKNFIKCLSFASLSYLLNLFTLSNRNTVFSTTTRFSMFAHILNLCGQCLC